ncbi:hypothetical protein D3C87_1379560 [compost metagenome]
MRLNGRSTPSINSRKGFFTVSRASIGQPVLSESVRESPLFPDAGTPFTMTSRLPAPQPACWASSSAARPHPMTPASSPSSARRISTWYQVWSSGRKSSERIAARPMPPPRRTTSGSKAAESVLMAARKGLPHARITPIAGWSPASASLRRCSKRISGPYPASLRCRLNDVPDDSVSTQPRWPQGQGCPPRFTTRWPS